MCVFSGGGGAGFEEFWGADGEVNKKNCCSNGLTDKKKEMGM